MASNIEIKDFSFQLDKQWVSITVLPDENVLLKDDANQIELAPFTRAYLFENTKLYTIKEFGECLAGIKCSDFKLAKRIKALPFKQKRTEIAHDVCIDSLITCYIYPAIPSNYTYSAFVFSNNINSYYLQVQTTLLESSEFIKQLNKIKLKRKG